MNIDALQRSDQTIQAGLVHGGEGRSGPLGVCSRVCGSITVFIILSGLFSFSEAITTSPLPFINDGTLEASVRWLFDGVQ